MRMDDPIPTFTYVVEQLKERYPDLAYLHTITPLAPGNEGPKVPSVRLPRHSPHARARVLTFSPANSKRTSWTDSGLRDR